MNDEVFLPEKTVNNQLPAEYKTLEIKPMRVSERLLSAEAWLQENRGAIDEYNQHVLENGVFSNGLRTF